MTYSSIPQYAKKNFLCLRENFIAPVNFSGCITTCPTAAKKNKLHSKKFQGMPKNFSQQPGNIRNEKLKQPAPGKPFYKEKIYSFSKYAHTG
jgi:hypothetical protein